MTDEPRHRDMATPDTDGGHISPELISVYLADALSAEERTAVQEHLVECRECRQDLIEASILGDSPEERLRRGRRGRWWTVAIPAAAAAVLGGLLLLPGDSEVPESPVLRGQRSEGTRQFEVVSPQEGQELSRDSVVFTWRSDGEQAHYVLTVTDGDGDVVWTVSTSDTIARLPDDVLLESGESFFWYVDALLEGARSSTTGFKEFRVRQ